MQRTEADAGHADRPTPSPNLLQNREEITARQQLFEQRRGQQQHRDSDGGAPQ
jgi:hypothetical protein